jgi:predicted nuclease of predicted toxin-antitoxin system
MRFLVDENLPPRLAAWLCAHGHDALHVSDCGLLGCSDAAIADFAEHESRVIITRDADFENLSASKAALRVMLLGIGNAPTPELLA